MLGKGLGRKVLARASQTTVNSPSARSPIGSPRGIAKSPKAAAGRVTSASFQNV